jgi:alanine racemase
MHWQRLGNDWLVKGEDMVTEAVSDFCWPVGRPTVAVIDLDAVADNVRTIKSRLLPGTELWAVVKANGYGHGAVAVARTALAAGANALAVAIPEEGDALRRAGVGGRILVLGPTFPSQVDTVLDADLEVMVFDADVARRLSDQALSRGRRVPVHLKVDTGMSRLGVRWDTDPAGLARQVAALGGLELVGLATHLASADESDSDASRVQWERFLTVVDEMRRQGIEVRWRHAANSAATVRWPGMHADAVRVGLALYGVSPWPETPAGAGRELRPVMTVLSQVAQVKQVPAGTAVGYGGTFVAETTLVVATVPIGYADGYDRRLSNRADAIVGGQRARVAGRVSMDQTVLALPASAAVAVGDPVVLMGRWGSEHITAADWARWMNTIPYEVLTGIGARVPRLYRMAGVCRDQVDDAWLAGLRRQTEKLESLSPAASGSL